MWYPSDYEIFHGMKQNFSRTERGFSWPAFWNIDDCTHNVRFKKIYKLVEDEYIDVSIIGQGYIKINNKMFACGNKLFCKAGTVEIIIAVGNMQGLPSAFVEGKTINSDSSWVVDDYTKNWVSVGCNDLYTDNQSNPNKFDFSYKSVYPVVSNEADGLFYDFGKEIMGKITIKNNMSNQNLKICYGESEKEAHDVDNCYYWDSVCADEQNWNSDTKAFRYIFIPNAPMGKFDVYADLEYVDRKMLGEFKCNDKLINKIWDISAYTFELTSRMFFLDGIKRDRWIWSGDAYQCYFINRYLFFDEEICKRTIIALRGKDVVKQHINTIVDYSLLWIISIEDHYYATADIKFLEIIFERMKILVDYCIKRTDDKGFIVGSVDDWVFIDWADMDMEGPVCAEQILFAQCLSSIINCCKVLEKPYNEYEKRHDKLISNLNKYFWDSKKGAYINGYVSGKHDVTRQANIFAILFNIADDKKRASIAHNVLLNDDIDPITTPYFKYYELEVLCKLGYLGEVMQIIKEYWGGMIDQGATTFWEKFDPKEDRQEQYSMYEDKYGKSLCHAWGASPIYLIGRYFIGLCPIEPGYKKFRISPKLNSFTNFTCKFPVKNGIVKLDFNNNKLCVISDVSGGVLNYKGKEYIIKKDNELVINNVVL
ncbi:alpha-L-rhamnosidase [Vallitalea sediminicola]